MDNQNNSKKDSGIGPIIGSIVIIILIVLGGLYFWSYKINKQKSIIPTFTEQKNEKASDDLNATTSESSATTSDVSATSSEQ